MQLQTYSQQLQQREHGQILAALARLSHLYRRTSSFLSEDPERPIKFAAPSKEQPVSEQIVTASLRQDFASFAVGVAGAVREKVPAREERWKAAVKGLQEALRALIEAIQSKQRSSTVSTITCVFLRDPTGSVKLLKIEDYQLAKRPADEHPGDGGA